MIELAILGPLEARRDGVAVRVGAAKERALLALLVLHRGDVVPRERLVEALWGERPPETASHALEVYVSKLRRALGREVVETCAGGYRLALDVDAVDASRFERLVDRARTELVGDVASAAQTLREALSLWRGPALVDVAYEEFAQSEIGRLEELRLVALEERIEADLRLGRHTSLVAEVEALVREHPLRERLRGQLMLALYRSGRQSDALDVFDDGRETLLTELGLDPSAELRNLQSSILRQDPALDVEPIELRLRRRLPTATTPFIGRQEEVAAILGRFRDDDARLVTLVGAGGSGKTRLAIQVAHDLAGAYDDGVYFVDLAPLRDPRLLEPAIAAALRTPHEIPLGDYLAQRRLVLVLDNFEQLDAAGPTVGELLRRAPQLAVLVTSRAALRIYGEHVFAVGALSREDAAALFAARALAAGRQLQPSRAVDELCAWLDRLPLAIELVAARARESSPERLLAALPPRLELASDGPRDAPHRHQTLRATIDWSHGLLSAEEKVALARVGIFRGGFTPDAARTVCSAALTALAALVSASLLVEIEAAGEEPRLTMLETIREYACERADSRGETASLRERHAKYFFALAERAEPELERAAADWHRRLEADYENLRAALDWFATDGTGSDELRFAVALRRFWLVRGHAHEGEYRLEQALARRGDQPELLRATAMGAAAQLALTRSDLTKAKDLTQASLELARSIDESRLVAFSFNRLADIAKAEHDHEAAGRHYAAALEVARMLPEQLPLAAVLTNAGSFALMRHDLVNAEKLTSEALAHWRALENIEGIQIVLSNLAAVAIERGGFDEAIPCFEESLTIARQLGFTAALAQAIGDSATVAIRIGAVDRAAILIAAMDGLLEAIDATPSPHAIRKRQEAITTLEDALPSEKLAPLRAAGQGMSRDEAVAFALETLQKAAERPAGHSRAAR